MAFGLFKKKKKKEEKKDSRYLNLTVREVKEVAKEAVNVIFEKPTENFHYKPGQFITLIMRIDDKKIRRAYSLCTTPLEDEYPAVTVKRVPAGILSNYVNDHVKAGDVIEVMEPMGMFTTEYEAKNKREAMFFGGGSGITPLISIIRTLLISEPESKVLLVYGNRDKDYIAFYDVLNNLVEANKDRFTVKHILEHDPSGIADFTGRPTTNMIKQIVAESGFSSPECYICGPEPMMNIIDEGLQLAGINKEKIRMESFEIGKTSPVIEEAVEKKSPAGSSEVTILMDGEEHVIQVSADQSILDAGLDNDLDMPYSCQSGLCTACRGKCLEGDISLDEAEGLSQDEIDEGYRLLCIGKPVSEKITVEIG